MQTHRTAIVFALLSIAHYAGATTTEEDREESELQADVYNALYEAHAKCDDQLNQSRSEFIVEMFERNRGNKVSKELLRKLLLHNIRIARAELDETRRDRERYVSKRMGELEAAEESDSRSNDRFRERQEQLRVLDERIGARKRYIEVNLCVLSILQKDSNSAGDAV